MGAALGGLPGNGLDKDLHCAAGKKNCGEARYRLWLNEFAAPAIREKTCDDSEVIRLRGKKGDPITQQLFLPKKPLEKQ